jgi:hypothetical protein
MAEYASTVLQNAIAVMTDPANEKEFRQEEYGALEAHLAHADMMSPDIAKVKQSSAQSDYMDYFKRDSQTVGAARTHSVTGAYGDTGSLALSFTTYSREFSISVNQADLNRYRDAQIYARQLKNTMIDLYEAIEDDAVSNLDTNRNTVAGNRSGLSTWHGVPSYTAHITNGNKANYYNYIKTDLRNDKYTGVLQEVHTGNMNAFINEYWAQGAGNDTNTAFQFPGFEFHTSNSITNGSDFFGTSYVVESGGIAAIPWIPLINRRGKVQGEYEWFSVPDPFGKLGNLAVFAKKTAADTSGSGGTTQDAVTIFEISVDVAMVCTPLSTGKVVYKYGLQTS